MTADRNAGGIAGRMDLGTISGCGGWGDVASESGDYAGGVAGLSLSSVRGSYTKCTLSGGSYLCFEMTGDGQFAVIPARHAPWWIWALAVAASAGAAGGILLLARKHRKREK